MNIRSFVSWVSLWGAFMGLQSGCSLQTTAPPPIPTIPTNGLSREWQGTLEATRAEVVSNRLSAPSWGRLGQTYQAAELNEAALACYREAQRLQPNEQRWWHLSGSLNLLEQTESALSDLREAIRTATNSELREVSRFLLARSLLEVGRPSEAANELGSLIRDSPHHAGARLALARIEHSQRRWPEAEALLNACVTNSYTARPAVLLLSQVRLGQGRSEDAQRLSQQGLAAPRPPDWPDPFLREVLRFKEGSAAEEDRANSLLSQGRLAEAEQLITQLTTRFASDANPHLLLGRLRLQQRRCEEAEQALRRHLELTPDSFNGQAQLGLALLCQQQWTQAIQTLRQAVALKPDSAQVHHNLGIALSRSGDSTHAVESFREALRYNPQDAGTCALLADALAKLGQRDEAKRYVERALQLNPKQSRALELQRILYRQ
ncbi:MAG: tetratricopeptide repeat protein [Verrucomicrobiales bacterium]|nr:tetratricopeptide repeat protein [Verrucomicrobiales bacterium]